MQSLFKRHAHPFITVLILCLLGGCSIGTKGPNKASAQAKVEEEMDKWMAGQKSETTTLEARINVLEPPISYKVRSVVPTEPDIPIEVLAENQGMKQKDNLT